MASRFVPNPAFPRLIAAGPQMVAGLHSLAEQKADIARSIAPVLTGAFRDSISAEGGVEGGKAVGRVLSDSPYWVYLEFGTSDTPTFATLRKALAG